MSKRRSTTRKVVGSLAIAGAAAAVAGLGTYGSFTGSTEVTTQVGTGTVAISLTPTGSATIPASSTGWVPGDSMTRAVTLANGGTQALSAITLASTASTSNALTSDVVNGLQLAVKSCSLPYSVGGSPSAPTYACTGGIENTIATGPAASIYQLNGVKALNPGGSDNLVVTISLPNSADNTFQNLSASLKLTFTGVQRAGQAN